MTRVRIDNREIRRDVHGRVVDAHDGSLEYFEGRFWWYGTAYGAHDGFTPDNDFVVYSSPDLSTWTRHGSILPDRPQGMFYRPYVVRRPLTGDYVLWFNWMERFWESRYGVAVSPGPAGPFEIVTESARIGHAQPGDLNLFVDDDGAGYLIYTSIAEKHGMSVERLAPDLLSSTLESSGVISRGDEAPALFRRDGVYYALFDSTCCFCPNGSGVKVYTAPAPLGLWTLQGNVNRRPADHPCGPEPVINAQQAHVARVPTVDGPAFLWTGDRWGSRNDGVKGHDQQYWGLLEFTADGAVAPMRWVNEWTFTLP